MCHAKDEDQKGCVFGGYLHSPVKPQGCSEFKAIEPPIRLSVPVVKVCLAWGLGHSEAKGASEAELCWLQDRNSWQELGRAVSSSVKWTLQLFPPLGLRGECERSCAGLRAVRVPGEAP